VRGNCGLVALPLGGPLQSHEVFYMWMERWTQPRRGRDLTRSKRSLNSAARKFLARNFSILSHADQPDGIPSLSTKEGQAWLETSHRPRCHLLGQHRNPLPPRGREQRRRTGSPAGVDCQAPSGRPSPGPIPPHRQAPTRDALGQISYTQHGTSARGTGPQRHSHPRPSPPPTGDLHNQLGGSGAGPAGSRAAARELAGQLAERR